MKNNTYDLVRILEGEDLNKVAINQLNKGYLTDSLKNKLD
jgi:hypothetical protein